MLRLKTCWNLVCAGVFHLFIHTHTHVLILTLGVTPACQPDANLSPLFVPDVSVPSLSLPAPDINPSKSIANPTPGIFFYLFTHINYSYTNI
jgi:hypothetical protein